MTKVKHGTPRPPEKTLYSIEPSTTSITSTTAITLPPAEASSTANNRNNSNSNYDNAISITEPLRNETTLRLSLPVDFTEESRTIVVNMDGTVEFLSVDNWVDYATISYPPIPNENSNGQAAATTTTTTTTSQDPVVMIRRGVGLRDFYKFMSFEPNYMGQPPEGSMGIDSVTGMPREFYMHSKLTQSFFGKKYTYSVCTMRGNDGDAVAQQQRPQLYRNMFQPKWVAESTQIRNALLCGCCGIIPIMVCGQQFEIYFRAAGDIRRNTAAAAPVVMARDQTDGTLTIPGRRPGGGGYDTSPTSTTTAAAMGEGGGISLLEAVCISYAFDNMAKPWTRIQWFQWLKESFFARKA